MFTHSLLVDEKCSGTVWEFFDVKTDMRQTYLDIDLRHILQKKVNIENLHNPFSVISFISDE